MKKNSSEQSEVKYTVTDVQQFDTLRVASEKVKALREQFRDVDPEAEILRRNIPSVAGLSNG